MNLDTDLQARLALLMSLATDDREAGASAAPPRLRHAAEAGVLAPLNLRRVRGKRTLLRVLMTNACTFGCHYCPMRRDRELRRTLLKPEEVVSIFLAAHARGWCDGLFLTTGIPGRPERVMDDLIAVLELLRGRHRFRGYVHVKLLPGAQEAQVERATELASRVSLNLEAPCGDSLVRIAPEKRLETTLVNLEQARSRVVARRREEAEGRPPDPARPGGSAGMTVQFVVGATADTDRALVERVRGLYTGGGIHHAHFSAFRPIRDTPMEARPAASPLREHRLYQVDHLLRGYGFDAAEVVYDDEGNLPLRLDPKSAWALAHPERFPVEVRTAPPEELVRVPGIGPVAARRIVAERSTSPPRGFADLRKLGVAERAAGFLTVGGRRLQDGRWTQQLDLWGEADPVGRAAEVFEFSPGTFR